MDGFLGIDISKGYADFVLLDREFNPRERVLQFDDTHQGHSSFKQWLKSVLIAHGLTHIYAGVESTGGFENNWYAMLVDMGRELPIRVTRLNPAAVRKAGDACLPRQHNDATSAAQIAGYLIRYPDQVSYKQADTTYASFRSFHNHIELLTRQNAQTINQLKQLLYSCFPELQRFCKKKIPLWVLELLMKYPTATKLSRARATTVARIRSVTLAKAHQLIDRARQSVSSREDELMAYTVEHMAREIRHMQANIKKLKGVLEQRCRGKEIDLLTSMKGVGSYSAACIMIQIEDIARFSSPQRLASYFGVHPVLKQSGDKQSVARMSKQGRSQIRKTLYMCASTAVMHDPHMKAIYHRHRRKGKNHKQAIGVIMHKMLRVIWGILTSQTPYDAQVDKANQQKQPTDSETSEHNHLASKRRLQDFDAYAPISRLAHKQRKAYQLSQVSEAEHVRDLVDTPIGQT